jgi:hypothetical protein
MNATPRELPGNPPPVSPYVYQALDYQNLAITITFNYDNTARALGDATIARDQGCLYGTIYIGLGGDGTVLSSTKKIPVQQGVGVRTFAQGQLNAIGLISIDDILSSQITAGP